MLNLVLKNSPDDKDTNKEADKSHRSKTKDNIIKNSSGFLPEEREWLSKFISIGFVDSFRYLSNESKQYSWWSYRANARQKNLGWRIDYNMISESLLPKLRRSCILSEVKHSDHCPVLVEIST